MNTPITLRHLLLTLALFVAVYVCLALWTDHRALAALAGQVSDLQQNFLELGLR